MAYVEGQNSACARLSTGHGDCGGRCQASGQWCCSVRKGISSSDQKGDLDRQLARLTEYAVNNKMVIVDAVKEVGSGLNGHRKGMIRLLGNAQAQTILAENYDRLMRFGFEYVESALAAQGRKIVVMESEETTDDIVRDLHEVIAWMCARLYGKRSAKNRAQKALDAIHEAPHE